MIGKNTVDCMRNGIMYGTAAMLDGMLDRVEEELGSRATVVATGGMAQFIVAPVAAGRSSWRRTCCSRA